MDANALVAGDAEDDTDGPPKREDGWEVVLESANREAAGTADASFEASGGTEEAEEKEKGVDVVVDVPKPEKPANVVVVAGY